MSDTCILCGSPLQYFDVPKTLSCSVCGKEFSANACCANGHYICDTCHADPAVSVIAVIAEQTTSKNPLSIAKEIMQNTAVHMHGPEHHSIVGAALFAAYKNAGGEVLDTMLPAILARGKKVPGGFCGMAGCCGAAVSAGIFYSVVTKTTPLSTDSWANANRLTGRCLAAIAEYGGPRCCKRDSFIAIREAAAFTAETLGVVMDTDSIGCNFSAGNSDCLHCLCPFYSL